MTTTYYVNDVPKAVTDLIVTSIRVVAHTMGPVAPGANLSQNHWSIYLIHTNGSVRLNMQLQNPSATSSRGLLTVTSHGYTTVSTSAVKSWDFGVSHNLAVWFVIQVILDKARGDYDMAEGGVGCRYWISVVMADLADTKYVSTTTVDGFTVDGIIRYNYSVGQDPILLEVKRGRFLQIQNTLSTSAGSSYTTQTASWSDWAWWPDHGKWCRTRQKANSEWEYDYQDPL